MHSNTSKKWILASDEAAACPIEKILVNSVTDFPLFAMDGNDYSLYAAPGFKWTSREIENLNSHGHKVLFYHTADSSKFDIYCKISGLPTIDPHLPPIQRIINITDVAADMTRLLYESPMTEFMLEKGKEVAVQLVACMREDSASIAALGKLANHHWYTYYHSARVAAYSVAIAIEMGLTNQIQLEELAVGCLFHDIGKSKINLEILNKSGPLVGGEWTEIRRHPEYGDEIVQNSLQLKVPRDIILHHHERLDGEGYPHRLTAAEIITEVRIASFADMFDAMTTNRPYQPSHSKFEALDIIRHRFFSQVDKDCYKALVIILQRATVKP